VGQSEGKTPPARPNSRWVDNIKIDLQEIGEDSVDWIDVVLNRDKW